MKKGKRRQRKRQGRLRRRRNRVVAAQTQAVISAIQTPSQQPQDLAIDAVAAAALNCLGVVPAVAGTEPRSRIEQLHLEVMKQCLKQAGGIPNFSELAAIVRGGPDDLDIEAGCWAEAYALQRRIEQLSRLPRHDPAEYFGRKSMFFARDKVCIEKYEKLAATARESGYAIPKD